MPVSKKPRKPARRSARPVERGYLLSASSVTRIALVPHLALEKLRTGTFRTSDWQEYGCFSNVIQLLAVEHRAEQIIALGARTNMALNSMRERAQRLGRWGCSGDEYVALRSAINPMDDFLRTCTNEQVKRALGRLDKAEREMRERNVMILEIAA